MRSRSTDWFRALARALPKKTDDLAVEATAAGGLVMSFRGSVYRVETDISYPGSSAGWNSLGGNRTGQQDGWTVRVQQHRAVAGARGIDASQWELGLLQRTLATPHVPACGSSGVPLLSCVLTVM